LFGWTYEGMHVRGAYGHDEKPIFKKKPSAFECDMIDLYTSGAWSSSQLEDHSKQLSWQCASIPTRYNYGGKSVDFSKNSLDSYNSSYKSYKMTSSSF